MKIIDTAWTHIKRSPYQAFAAILTMFLTLLVIGMFAVATAVSLSVLGYFESKPQLTVFFTDKATAGDINALQVKLEQSGKAATPMKYVSKEDALAIYKEQNKNDPLLLEMVTADILPASLEVTAVDPRYLHELEPIIKQSDGVEEVVFQKDVVDTLLSWTNAIRLVGGMLAALLAFNSFLIIMTIIGMKIALRKDEIEIMKLIGASQWYIRMPFIIEGGWYGIIGGFTAWCVIMIVLFSLREQFLSFLGAIPLIQTVLIHPFDSVTVLYASVFMVSLMLTGFLLGAFGSVVALVRYIKL